MRTTINLPDSLAERARERATQQGRTFTSLVEEGLRIVLEQPSDHTEPLPPLPTWGSPEDEMLVDITDKDALWDALDAHGWK